MTREGDEWGRSGRDRQHAPTSAESTFRVTGATLPDRQSPSAPAALAADDPRETLHPVPHRPEVTWDGDLRAVIDRGIKTVYQPLVDIQSRDVVGYEALARGPAGSVLESPSVLFDAARKQGVTAALDRACCGAALRGALDAGLYSPAAVFVNIEPEVIGAEIDSVGRAFLRDAHRRLRIFFEVTERALMARPAELLDTVERMRAAGFGIALDDVGSDHGSLALLPLLRPDVVKLDMSLVHDHPSRRSGDVMNGVCAYAEQTGALIVAEGIETAAHLIAAKSLGATLAQGWLFGRPGPLPRDPQVRRPTATLGVPARVTGQTPLEIVHTRRTVRLGRKDVLLSMTRALEAQALELGEHAVVTAAFQHVRFFTERSSQRYRRIAARASLTVAIGVGMSGSPTPGVRDGDLDPDDPLVHEWDVAVLGPHYAGAIVARDLGDTGPDHERCFEFVVTFDRDLVVEVAAALIARVNDRSTPRSGLR